MFTTLGLSIRDNDLWLIVWVMGYYNLNPKN